MQFATTTSSSTVMASPVSYQKDVTNIRNDPAFWHSLQFWCQWKDWNLREKRILRYPPLKVNKGNGREKQRWRNGEVQMDDQSFVDGFFKRKILE